MVCIIGVTEAVKPTADSEVTAMTLYLAIGVGVGAALLVVVTTTVVLWCLVKNNRSKRGKYMDYKWGDVGFCSSLQQLW